MNSLFNKVAIITGASSGIGRASALTFAKEGAAVVVGARREAELKQLVQEIEQAGGRAVWVVGDAKDESFAKAMVQSAVDNFGGLDVAFNNAGTLGAMGATSEISTTGWHDTLDVNLSSAFYAAKYQIPALLKRGSGSIIFTSTFVGYTVGFSGLAAYSASKAGLIGLTQALAVEYGAHAIRVNALLPGGTDTPMGRQIAASPEALAYVKNLHALKRIATPEEIAQSALYLASDASSFVTGNALLVDGGISIHRP